MTFHEHLFVVRATVDPAHDDEFNRWYNEEHIPDVLKLPGCLEAARYRVLDGDGSHQYLAVYAFESEDAMRTGLASDYFKNYLVKEFDRAVGSFSTRARTTYQRIYEQAKPS